MAKSFCTFFVGDYFFGVETDWVTELNQKMEVTRIPRAGRGIGGYINLRGQLTLAIDLSEALGIIRHRERAAITHVNILIVEVMGESTALIVDKIGDILELEDEGFEEPPSSLPAESLLLTSGAYKLDKYLMVTLSLDNLLAQARAA
jgi:purine-binding chemotaxis protein CheW